MNMHDDPIPETQPDSPEAWTDQIGYDTVKQMTPTLLPIIRELLDKGQTPNQIAQAVGKKAGPSVFACLLGACHYMKAHPEA